MKKIIYHSVILLMSALLLVFYINTVSNDFLQYQIIFNLIADFEGSVIEAIIKYRYEPGFTALYYYLTRFVAANNAFFIIAFFILTIKYLLFLKYLKYPVAAWFLYSIVFMPILDASQLRTAIASTMIIYVLLTSSSRGGYIFKAITASMFHYIALLIMTLTLYKKPFFTLLITSLFALLINTILGLISNDFLNVDMFISRSNDLSVNFFSSIAAAQLLLSLYCIINWKGFNDEQKKGGLLIMIGILLYYVLGYNPGIAHRIREISLLGIFPLLFLIRVKVNYTSLMAFTSVFYIGSYSLVMTIIELINLS